MTTGSATSSERLAFVDAVRAVAAIAVIGVHVWAYWLQNAKPPMATIGGVLARSWAVGGAGVDVFIVVSGFVLALPFARDRGRTVGATTFWAKRAARILPPYYVALAVAFLLASFSTTASRTVGPRTATLGDLVRHVALVQTWSPAWVGRINGSFWSIALEAQLYLVFPVLLLAWRRWGYLPMLVGSTGLAAVAWNAWPSVGTNAPHRLVQFVIGIGVAQIVANDRRRWGSVARVACAPLVVCTIVVFGTGISELARVLLWGPTAASMLLAAWTLPSAWFSKGPLKLLSSIGRVSFSMYLLHQPILLLVAPEVRRITTDVTVVLTVGIVVAIALSLAAALPMYRLVETPSILLASRVSRGKLWTGWGRPRPSTAVS